MLKLIGIGESYILMFGNEQNKQKHRHYAIQLIIPISSININGLNIDSSVLIDSYVDHIVYGDAEMLSLLFNPESEIGRQVKQSFLKEENKGIVCLNQFKLKRYAKSISKDALEYKHIHKMINQVMNELLRSSAQISPLDTRISAMNNYIQASDFASLRYDDVFDTVYLSKSRLRHLFKDEMGIPLMKYITWKRLLHTSIQLLNSNMSLTYAAHKYGFADVSHFSRIFKANFGVNPRSIFQKELKHNRLVHVFTLDSDVK